MKRRLPSLLAHLVLALPLCAIAVAPPAAIARSSAADDAETLKVAEAKLAALAKEAKPEGAPAAASKQSEKKPAKKPAKRHAKAGKKGVKTAHATVGPKAVEPMRAPQKNLNRRVTQAEVQNVLATTRDFAGFDLSGMNLVGIDFNGVKFNRASLRDANLERADLAEADLELADLTGADLRGASLNQARLRGTRLEGANLEGALWIDKTVCRKGSVGSCME